MTAKLALTMVLLASPAPAPPDLVKVEAVGSMAWARGGHAATALPDGRVLVTGGSAYGNESPLPWAEVFDPRTRQFHATGAMQIPRNLHASIMLDDGRVLVAGGWRAGYVVASWTAEIWDPHTGEFSPTGRMTTPRGSGTAIARLDDGRLLLIGGTREGEFGAPTKNIDVFDPVSREFELWGELAIARTGAGAWSLDDKQVLVFGGAGRCCDPATDMLRRQSQEILNLDARTSRLAEMLPFTFVAEHLGSLSPNVGPPIAVSGGRVNVFDGAWRQLSELRDGELSGKSIEVIGIGRDIAIGQAGKLVAIHTTEGRVQWVHGPTTGVLNPTVTPLGDGRALVTGGGRDLRTVTQAWLVTAEERE